MMMVDQHGFLQSGRPFFGPFLGRFLLFFFGAASLAGAWSEGTEVAMSRRALARRRAQLQQNSKKSSSSSSSSSSAVDSTSRRQPGKTPQFRLGEALMRNLNKNGSERTTSVGVGEKDNRTVVVVHNHYYAGVSTTPPPMSGEAYREEQQQYRFRNTSDCIVEENPNTESWFGASAEPGSPCIFGLDKRDEDAHCIDIGGDRYGSYGWCYTSMDKSLWGSCSSDCPLAGPLKNLGSTMEEMKAENQNLKKGFERIEKQMDKLLGGEKVATPEKTETAKANSTTTTTEESSEAGAAPENSGGAAPGAEAAPGAPGNIAGAGEEDLAAAKALQDASEALSEPGVAESIREEEPAQLSAPAPEEEKKPKGSSSRRRK